MRTFDDEFAEPSSHVAAPAAGSAMSQHHWRTAIGLKVSMAVSGIVPVAFLAFHPHGNLIVYGGSGALNSYSSLASPRFCGSRAVLLLSAMSTSTRPRCTGRVTAATSEKETRTMTAEAKWPVYLLRLKSRSEVAERTLEFRFDKPAGMTFKAGQFMDLTLIDPPETDAEGNTRGFSINSAPDEPELMFTTRLRDTAFKRVLRAMPLGTEIKVEGPFGDLTLHNNTSRPAVLLAGGIGITPFRSIVRRAAHQKLPHRILLFYANRRPEDAPFLDELASLAAANPNFTVIPTMTRMSGSHLPWNGETGYIDHELIEKYLKHNPSSGKELSGPIYYAAGPPAMVSGLRGMLNEAGVDDDDIRTEAFTGY